MGSGFLIKTEFLLCYATYSPTEHIISISMIISNEEIGKKKKWNERHSAVIALIVTCNFMPIIFFRRFHFPPPYHSIKWPLGPFSTEFREVRLATNGPENQIFHQSPQRKRMLHFTPHLKRFVIARRCRKALLLPK